MATVPVDADLVRECCLLHAAEIADDVQRFIDGHTSVGLERTVARAYGIVGADQEGTPLVNVLVDRLHRERVLDRGVAYFIGRALLAGAPSVQEAAESLGLRRLSSRRERARGASSDAVRAALAFLTPRRRSSASIARGTIAKPSRSRHEVGITPQKYVIVATGNIYDDAVQAKAAALRRRRHRRRHSRDGAVAPRLRPRRSTTEGYGRHLRHAGELPHHPPRGRTEISVETGKYLAQTNYSSRASA